MRKIIAASAALAAVLVVGTAQAATTYGDVQSVDTRTHTIALWDGTTYQLAPGVSTDGVSTSSAVNIDYKMVGKHRVATGVRIVPDPQG